MFDLYFFVLLNLRMRLTKYSLVFLFFLLGIAKIFSVPPPPPGGSPGCWPPPCVPVDGGVTFLIVAGAAYGVKKIVSARHKQKSIN